MNIELVVTGAAVLIQLISSVLALRLIVLTGKRTAGLLIILTAFLMAFRRALSFYWVVTGGTVKIDLFGEVVAFVISVLVLIGVLYITRLMLAIKSSTDSLRASEERLADITSSLGEGIYVLDARGHVVFINEEAERLLGWTRAELLDKNVHDLIHNRRADGSPLPFEECPIVNVIRTGGRFSSQDEVFVRRDGTVFPVSAISTPVVRAGKILASVTAFRDISGQQKLEDEVAKLHKLESVGVLAGGIAHDFNNLLQAILGNLSLARMVIPREHPISSYLASAESASLQAKELSYRLLTFSKGGEPVKKRTSIATILAETARLALSGSNVGHDLFCAQDLYPVEVDGGQIRQVFSNIILNAREAMPGGGTVLIRCENVQLDGKGSVQLRPGRYVRITIADRGRGIPGEHLHRVFDPYFSTKAMGSEKGRGLGLSISHSIVRKHAGTITVESAPGTGSTFVIHLPAAPDPAVDHITGKGVGAVPPAGNSRGRILLMDDEERVLTTIGTVLNVLGYDALGVSNGEAAVEAYRTARETGNPFDAVILDLTIQGGMGGVKTVQLLREIDPGVKAIVSSGYADSPVMENFSAYGFAAVIAKPYEVEQIRALLDRVLAAPA